MKTILRHRITGRMLIWILVITTIAIGMRPPDGVAMLISPLPTAAEASSDSQRIADLQKIQSVLESKVVRQRLADLGLTAEEIDTRLSQLSNGQLHQLAMQVDAMIPAGNGLGIVIALLVIAILAVILIYLLDHRIIVTKNGSDK